MQELKEQDIRSSKFRSWFPGFLLKKSSVRFDKAVQEIFAVEVLADEALALVPSDGPP